MSFKAGDKVSINVIGVVYSTVGNIVRVQIDDSQPPWMVDKRYVALVDLPETPTLDTRKGLTFTEALKSGRPIRRSPPGRSVPEVGPWLFLGVADYASGCWRNIQTGAVVGLHKADYLATDWEVMP